MVILYKDKKVEKLATVPVITAALITITGVWMLGGMWYYGGGWMK